jgi:hypothetical protein
VEFESIRDERHADQHQKGQRPHLGGRVFNDKPRDGGKQTWSGRRPMSRSATLISSGDTSPAAAFRSGK